MNINGCMANGSARTVTQTRVESRQFRHRWTSIFKTLKNSNTTVTQLRFEQSVTKQ